MLFLFVLLLVVMLVLWKQGIFDSILQQLFSDSKTASIQMPSKPGKPLIKSKPKDLPKILLNENKGLNELLEKNFNKNNVKLHISKSLYKLTLIYDTKKIKEYPIVLGGDPVNDKLRKGDKRTPEGNFKIKNLYPHRAWSKFIWLNYPTSDSWKKYSLAKAEGKISESDKIGGQIGIHGVPDGGDRLIDHHINWTLGCISLKIKDINEIFSVVQAGTPIKISH